MLKDITSTLSSRVAQVLVPGREARETFSMPCPSSPTGGSQMQLVVRASSPPGLPGREAKRDAKVERALVQSALNGSIRAQVFWLVNRAPYKWQPVWRIRVAPRLPSLASMLNVSEPRLREWAYHTRSARSLSSRRSERRNAKRRISARATEKLRFARGDRSFRLGRSLALPPPGFSARRDATVAPCRTRFMPAGAPQQGATPRCARGDGPLRPVRVRVLSTRTRDLFEPPRRRGESVRAPPRASSHPEEVPPAFALPVRGPRRGVSPEHLSFPPAERTRPPRVPDPQGPQEASLSAATAPGRASPRPRPSGPGRSGGRSRPPSRA